jgi:hypothetical protein
MGTRTISLKDEAYERLRAARRYPTESFSEVVLRASWPEDTVSAGQLIRRLRTAPPLFTGQELDAADQASHADESPEDKWFDR